MTRRIVFVIFPEVQALDVIGPSEVFAQAARFFAQSDEEKLPYKVGRYNIGYLPFGAQVVRHSPVNNNTKPNFSESFYVTRDRAPDQAGGECVRRRVQ